MINYSIESAPENPEPQRDGCQKCDNQFLTPTLDEPSCGLCGWVDYTYNPTANGTAFLSSGTTFLLRYKGNVKTWPNLKDVLVRVKVRPRPAVGSNPAGSRLPIIVPSCPFCHRDMTETSLGGINRKNHRGQTRYKCEASHRVTLINWTEGWK